MDQTRRSWLVTEIIQVSALLSSSELFVYSHFSGSSEVGQFITDQLGLDLPAATKLLNDKKNEAWLVQKVGRDKVEVSQIYG